MACCDKPRIIMSPYLGYILLIYLLSISTFISASNGHRHRSVKDFGHPPKLTEQPSDVISLRDEPTQMNCAAEGSTKIRWYHKGKLIKDGSAMRTVSSVGPLFFLSVSNAHAGSYFCEAVNQYGVTRSRNATLSIAYLREEFQETPKTVKVGLSERAVLVCTPPDGLPAPTIEWLKEGQQVNIGSSRSRIHLQPDSGNLVIEEVRYSDQGSYICKAENIVGTRETRPARLIIQSKPQFNKIPDNIEVRVDDDVKLECSASGDPPPRIRWTRVGGLPLSEDRVSISNKSLEIFNVIADDQGEYICTATNDAGSVSTSVAISVQSHPIFIVRPRDIRSNVNEVAQFECTAVGSPSPTIMWSREGVHVLMFPNTTHGRIVIDSMGTLSINGVRKEDQGQYVCSALSDIESIMTSAHLEVMTPGDIPPPIIRLGPINQTLPLASRATFRCDAGGEPTPDIRWLFNNKYVGEDDHRIVIDDDGTLTVEDLRHEDSGIYTCVATNDNGETREHARLDVAGILQSGQIFRRAPETFLLPEKPQLLHAVNVTDTWITLSWKRPARVPVDLEINGYIIEYYSPDLRNGWNTIREIITDTVYRVNDLTPNTRYMFLVKARNDHGSGPPSEVSEAIKTLSNPFESYVQDHVLAKFRSKLSTMKVLLRDVNVINSTVVRVNWTLNGDKGSLEGFRIWFVESPGISLSFVVWSGKKTSYLATDLRKFTKYQVFVEPFYKDLIGTPSNIKYIQTMEDAPTSAPADLSVTVLNSTSVLVKWRELPKEDHNGILLGYKVLVRSELTSQNLVTNETEYKLTNLIEGLEYKLTVMAYTSQADGPVSQMSFNTLQTHVDINNVHHSFKEPMLFGFLLALPCTLIAATILLIIWLRQNRWKTTSAIPPMSHKNIDMSNAFPSYPRSTNESWSHSNRYSDSTKEHEAFIDNNKFINNLDTDNYRRDYGHHGLINQQQPQMQDNQSEYAEIGQNLNTFGNRYQPQFPTLTEPYASTTLINDLSNRSSDPVRGCDTPRSLAQRRMVSVEASGQELENLLTKSPKMGYRAQNYRKKSSISLQSREATCVPEPCPNESASSGDSASSAGRSAGSSRGASRSIGSQNNSLTNSQKNLRIRPIAAYSDTVSLSDGEESSGSQIASWRSQFQSDEPIYNTVSEENPLALFDEDNDDNLNAARIRLNDAFKNHSAKLRALYANQDLSIHPDRGSVHSLNKAEEMNVPIFNQKVMTSNNSSALSINQQQLQQGRALLKSREHIVDNSAAFAKSTVL